jgi:hypothetical protein
VRAGARPDGPVTTGRAPEARLASEIERVAGLAESPRNEDVLGRVGPNGPCGLATGSSAVSDFGLVADGTGKVNGAAPEAVRARLGGSSAAGGVGARLSAGGSEGVAVRISPGTGQDAVARLGRVVPVRGGLSVGPSTA